jgi:hypothetical protein
MDLSVLQLFYVYRRADGRRAILIGAPRGSEHPEKLFRRYYWDTEGNNDSKVWWNLF